MKYTFKNGASVEGTMEQILAIAKGLGETVDLRKISGGVPRGYYNSEHSGILRIKDMNSMHIRNAMLKMSRKHFEELGKSTKMTDREFLRSYMSLADNVVVEDLFKELSNRL